MIPLLLNVAAVLFMTGFIWTMQLLHYPLLDRVGEDAFPRYETDHNKLFGKVAAPGILLTLVSAVLLLFARPAGVPVAALAGIGLFGMIVVSTAIYQAPQQSTRLHSTQNSSTASTGARTSRLTGPGPPPGRSTPCSGCECFGKQPEGAFAPLPLK